MACLLLVVLVRTWRFSSRQADLPPAGRIDLPEQALVDRFAQSLAIPTVSYSNPARIDREAFARFQSFLESSFPLVHQRLARMTGIDFGDDRNQSLLFNWPGTDPGHTDAILLMAHYDVVPVEDQIETKWTHPPFAGATDDRFVWGRGAIDNKAAVMGIMEAIERLLADGFQPTRTIYVALGHDEEIGGQHGNASIARWMRQEGIRLAYVLDEGGGIFNDFGGLSQPAAFIGIGEKGFATLQLSVELKEAGHASMPPPLSDTAVGILAGAVQRLQQSPPPARLSGGMGLTLDYLGPEMPLVNRVAVANRWLFSPLLMRQLASTPLGNAAIRTTVAPTLIEGGVKDNVLPARATLTINVRVLQGDSVASAIEFIRRVIDDPRVVISEPTLQREPSRLSSTESPSFTMLHRTIREIYPSVLVAPFVVVAGTDSAHYDDPSLSRDIYRFVPWKLGKTDLTRIHGLDERLSRDDYMELVHFYERLIRNSAAL